MSQDACRVSACIIARDEEPFIGGCLRSLQGAVDEVVLVDTGSVDRTPEIAQAMGARVLHRPWPGDFATARNWSLDAAHGQWVLTIDADEELLEGSAQVLRATVESGRADGYLVTIHHFADDDDAHLVSHRVALFRRHPRHRFEGRIHEQVGESILANGGAVAASALTAVHRGYERWVVAAKRKHERNLALLREEAHAEPDDLRWHYYLGQEYQALGDLPEAISHFRRALELAREPNHGLVVPAVLRLILAYARLSRWSDVFETSEKYRQVYPLCTDLCFLEARAAVEVGDLRRAIRLLLDATTKGDPPPGSFQMMLPGTGSYRSWSALGTVFQQMRRRTDAVGAYLQALRANPTYRSAIKALATLLLTTDPAEKVVAFILDHIASRHTATLTALWEVMVEAGAYPEALGVLDQVGQEDAAQRALRRGITLAAMERAADAHAELVVAVEGETIRDELALDGALASVNLHCPDLARRFMGKAHPARFAAGLDVLAQAMGDGAETIGAGVVRAPGWAQAASRMPAVSPSADPAQVIGAAWQLVERSLILAQFGVLDRLVEFIVGRGVAPANVRLDLGKLLHTHRHEEAAVELLLEAARAGAIDAKSSAILAQAALVRKDLDAAEDLLRNAMELDPANHGIAAALASLLAERGRVREAVSFLNEHIAAYPWAARLKDQRARLVTRLAASEEPS